MAHSGGGPPDVATPVSFGHMPAQAPSSSSSSNIRMPLPQQGTAMPPPGFGQQMPFQDRGRASNGQRLMSEKSGCP